MPSPAMDPFASRSNSLFKISRMKADKEAQLYIETAGKVALAAVRIGRSMRFLSEPIEGMAAGRVTASTLVAPRDGPRPTDAPHALMKVTTLHHGRAWPSPPASSRAARTAEHRQAGQRRGGIPPRCHRSGRGGLLPRRRGSPPVARCPGALS